MYSCPMWGDGEGGVRGDLEGSRRPGDLEAAQTRKITHILKKAGLRPGDRLLEIGTGWGGLAIAVGLRLKQLIQTSSYLSSSGC
jgi:cyclopropane-fatty-acyl-phospholipid synthase